MKHFSACVVLSISLCLLAGQALYAALPACKVELVGDFGRVRFQTGIADTAQERARGLMHVKKMPLLSGMLFIYETPRPVAFWMKNTFIPLDMLFFDEHGVVQKIHHNAVPHDETPIMGGENIRAVLEVNGGLSERLNLHVGTKIAPHHFDQKNFVICDD